MSLLPTDIMAFVVNIYVIVTQSRANAAVHLDLWMTGELRSCHTLIIPHSLYRFIYASFDE